MDDRFRTAVLALLRWRGPSWGAWAVGAGALVVALGIVQALTPVLGRWFGLHDAWTLGSLPLAAAMLLTGLVGGWPPAVAVGAGGIGVFALSLAQSGVRTAVLFAAALPLIAALGAIAMIAVLRDTLEQLEAERNHAAALVESQRLLFRELQHRVANNMQFISSLLALQSRRVTSAEDARQAMIDARQRVDVLARIHRRLTTPVSDAEDLGQMVEEICRDLLEATGAINIVCRVDMAATRLPLDCISALSLIVTELITNALKHAFPGRPGGTILVSLQPVATGRYLLEVRDDGVGLEAAYAAKPQSLGMRVIESLARRLGGTFSLAAEDGTVARLEFAPDAA